MVPLQWVALGYLLLLVQEKIHGFDLTADPIAWALILLGLHGLSPWLARPLLRQVAWVAAVISIPLWVPAVRTAVEAGNGSLGWALSLPTAAFGGLLCLLMSRQAVRARERNAVRVLQTGVGASVVVAALPVIVFGGGVSGLRATTAALSTLLIFYLMLVCFGFSGRSWAARYPAKDTADAEAAVPGDDPASD